MQQKKRAQRRRALLGRTPARVCVCNTVFSLIERGKFSSAYRVFFSCVLLSISLCLKTSENLDHKERHNSTPTLLKTQHKKCLPSKPRLLFRSLPPRKRKNVKRKPRECSRASLPRWISNYIVFFFSDLWATSDDGISVVTRANFALRKKRE